MSLDETSCFYCNLVGGCPEARSIIEPHPKDILVYGCGKFSEISREEKEVRLSTLSTFGLSAVALALINKPKEGTVEKKYTKEEMEEMPRNPLRKIAERLGMVPSDGIDATKDKLISFILKKQGTPLKKGGKKPEKSKEEDEESEGEDKEEKAEEAEEKAEDGVESEEEPEAPGRPVPLERPAPESSKGSDLSAQIENLTRIVKALGEQTEDLIKLVKVKFEHFDKCFAVLDRKKNMELGSLDQIGRATTKHGAEFDPAKFEESHSKRAKHTVHTGYIQRTTGEPVTEEEG